MNQAHNTGPKHGPTEKTPSLHEIYSNRNTIQLEVASINMVNMLNSFNFKNQNANRATMNTQSKSF